MLILSIPAVQTSLGKRVTKRLNEDFGTNINIERVGLQFNGDVELKQIYIEDHKQDTLIAIAELNTSILNFRNVINGKLNFGDIDIMELVFNIHTYEGERDTNLDIFVAKFDEDNPRVGESEFLLSSSDVSIYDGNFKLSDENRESVNILVFNDLNINATDFVIAGSDVRARINTLSFKDQRGGHVENLMTDFDYTLSAMRFDNLSIKTNKSILRGNLRFDYNREDFKDFEDKVNVTAKFTDSNIALNDLNMFYNEFGSNQMAHLNVELSGTLNDLYAKNLVVNASNRTRIFGDINFQNLFSKADGDFVMDGNFRNLSSNYNDLRALMPNVLGASIPSVFSKLGNFTITGNACITDSTIDTDIAIDTQIGVVETDMSMTHVNEVDNADYLGNLVFEDFDLGVLLNDPMIQTTSFNLDVDGSGFTLENLNSQVRGQVFNLTYNDYVYEDLEVVGNLEYQIFNGLLVANDKNFKFRFEGLADLSKEEKAFDFNANVSYANLKALNFVVKDSLAIFTGEVTTSMRGSSVDDAFGTLNFKNTTYVNEYDEYYFKDFKIESTFEQNKRTLTIDSPDIVQGSMSGDFKFKDIGKLVENSVGSLYTNYVPNKIDTEQYVEFNFNIYNKIVEVFYHDLKLAPNTKIKGRIETDEKQFNVTFSSPQIKLLDYFANDISVLVDNSNPVFNTYVEIDTLSTKFYNISKFNLINVTQRDTLFIKSDFKGGKGNTDEFNLNMFYTINESNNSVVGFQKSDITFKDNTWSINEEKNDLNKIAFTRNFKNFDISDIIMSHFEEKIEFSGKITEDQNKDLNLNFTEVDLTKITPRIDSLLLEGRVNGELKLRQTNGVYLPNSTVVISDLRANDFELGNLNAIVTGDQSLTNYVVDLSLENDNLKTLSAQGTIDVSNANSSIDLDVVFDEFLLDPLDPFGEGVITNIRGLVTGNAKVSGSLNEPDFDGMLLLDNAGLTIPYLNVDYSFDFDSQVKLESQRFIFQNVEITDSEYFSKATLNGFIGHQNFSNWSLGLEIDTERLLVLDTEYDEEELYYGTAFVTGKSEISGPTNELKIEFNGSTAEGTIFKIPLNDFETYGENSYIHFVTPEEKEARLKGEVVENTEVKGLELEFNLFVNPYADIEIVIDKKQGSTIQGKGNGNLLFDINTNGKFKMFGDFQIESGTYNFAYGGLVQKKLEVEPGGSMRWEGDPLKANIDLKAIYRTEANPSVLLDNPINRSIPVEVEINLLGRLEQPESDFTFNFPNVNSTIKSELDYRLETKESRFTQGTFLLVTGSFQSDIGLGQQAYGTVSDRVNALINSLIASDNEKLQVGFDYQIGEQTTDYQTDDRLGLTLSTKISDRVLINGKVGVPIGGVDQTVIAGDVRIDILLNEEGTLKASFFNRENSIRNFGEEIGYTQGAGLTYNVEFDNFKELFEILFKGKNKEKNQKKSEEPEKEVEEDLTPDFINIKSKKSTKNN
ncbi:MAG: translocation/assembly module TamB domain-containing protein [Psychroserpens sp.]|nr:translocation/assembly module TamB domain-containing protein [Psychroserpens sp.]MBO6653143.1 translocation/assembly module TamB domain-containing protein [Psychroserpens sp.]MBO6680829.1 translocation/assembly module TamB domain-containing protein [Psychroserpens sp.]MBO6750213.1 translocation/assembly module TamB domain-containing protein [Psychroserpens sp.]MBO6914694.1 translocation/assembly module TamB domain-containing protein [Psychroserpens sp.]